MLTYWKVCAFVTEVVGANAIVAGNSLGGFTALAAAAHAPNSIKVRTVVFLHPSDVDVVSSRSYVSRSFGPHQYMWRHDPDLMVDILALRGSR